MNVFFRRSHLGGMKVSGDLLEFVLRLGRSSMPDEFAGLLRERDGVVGEVVLPPDEESNESQVFYGEESLPIDTSVVGTVHSHPNGVLEPSSTDLKLFSSGRLHIIVGSPFGPDDWKAYDREGNEAEVEIVEDEALEDEWMDEFRDMEEFEGGPL